MEIRDRQENMPQEVFNQVDERLLTAQAMTTVEIAGSAGQRASEIPSRDFLALRDFRGCPRSGD